MKKVILVCISCLLFAVCGLWSAYAAVPHLINYQGSLADSSGNLLQGSYDVTFKIYDALTGGNLLWQETHSGVTVQEGLFNVILGGVTDLNLAFDVPYFLEIKVGSEVMSPRQQLTSVGYAVRAEKAETAVNADNAANADKVGGKTVSQIRTFGDRVTKQAGTVYQAEADGFAMATYNNGSNTGWVDSFNPPTTVVALQQAGGGEYTYISFPVKKGDYWKVRFGTVFWIPVGN